MSLLAVEGMKPILVEILNSPGVKEGQTTICIAENPTLFHTFMGNV